MTLRRSTRFRPRLEPLEDRRLLSAGHLDPTFGHGGVVTTDINGNEDFVGSGNGTGNILAMQFGVLPVVAGTSFDSVSGTTLAVVARYLPNGSPDPTFGNHGNQGIFTTPLADNFNFAEITGVASQPDGKIVVVGDTFSDALGTQVVFVERLDFFGNPDPSFNSTGQVPGQLLFPLPNLTLINTSGVVLQSNGKIDVAATVSSSPSSPSDLAVTRISSNGTPDTGYNSNGSSPGTAVADFGSANPATVAGIALTPGGKAVVTGTLNFGSPSSLIALAEFKLDGTSDTGFGSGGKESLPSQGTGGNTAGALMVGPDGKILVVGSADYATTNFDFLLARLSANGTPDGTFGSGGFVHNDFGTSNIDTATGVAFDLYGRIVVSGTSVQNVSGGAVSIALARYDPTHGALDTSFGSGGKVLTTFSNPSRPVGAPISVGIEFDDKIVVAGTIDDTLQNPSTLHDFLVARYLGDDGPDVAQAAAAVSNVPSSSPTEPGVSIALGSDPSAPTLAGAVTENGAVDQSPLDRFFVTLGEQAAKPALSDADGLFNPFGV
jgi:uncharacterized delta-60 repeat protein